MDQVREMSFLFPSESLGLNFAASTRPNTPVVIGSILLSREISFKELKIGTFFSKTIQLLCIVSCTDLKEMILQMCASCNTSYILN